jgi:RNA polymerase sigma-70 factor (ECF subfamily)
MTPAATATEAAVLLDEPAVDERALVDDVTVDAPPRLVLVPDTEDEPAGFDFELALQDASVRMRRYAVRRLYHDADADEIVQEAMLRALQHRSRFASADDLHAWLTVVTGHLVIDRIRLRGKATPVAELPSGSRVARDTADVVVARQEARVALDALEAMPTRQAAVLWAREVEGLDYAAIGTRYALSEASVRSLLHRARKTLRREYAARGGTLPAGGLVVLAPWLHPLRALTRLRDSARRLAGPAASVAVIA